MRLTGLVIRLHRDTPTGPGDITVRGFIEGFDSAARSLRLELDEVTYRQAFLSLVNLIPERLPYDSVRQRLLARPHLENVS